MNFWKKVIERESVTRRTGPPIHTLAMALHKVYPLTKEKNGSV